MWLAGRSLCPEHGVVELFAGEPGTAERLLCAGVDTLREIGEMTWFSTVAGLLGEAVLQAGGRDEAEVLAEASRDAAAPDDVYSQAIWRTVASTVHASSGRAESAEALAQEAVDLTRRSDFLLLHWYAFMNLARVLELLGRIPEPPRPPTRRQRPAQGQYGGRAPCEGDGDTAGGMACLIDPSCASRAEAAGGDPQTAMSGVRASADSPRCGEPVPQPLPFLGAGTALRAEAPVPSSKSRSNLAAKLSLPEVTPVRRTPRCVSSAA